MHHFRIILRFLLLLHTHTANGSELYSHSDAKLKCENRGGLQSNQDFIKDNRHSSLDHEQKGILNLQNGETAWIDGYAEYSKFLSWHGCYKLIKAVNSKRLDNANFIRCLDYCDQYKTQQINYVGLRNRLCFCITTENLDGITMKIDNSSNCSQLNPYNIHNYQSTDEKAISVFQIHFKLNWDPQPPTLKQCVYAKRVSRALVYGTSSCYLPEHDVDGLICTNGVTNKLNHSCVEFSEANKPSPAFCIQHQSTSWLRAKILCMQFSGKLVSEPLSAMQDKMMSKKKYWTGIFRSFRITSSTSRVDEVETACLAVTRQNDTLAFDPDNCTVLKKYLCSDFDYTLSKTPSGQTSFNPNMMSTKAVPVVTKTPDERNKNYDAIYITVALVLGVVSSVISCIVIRRRNKKTKHKRLQECVSTSLTNNESIEKPTDDEARNDDHARLQLRNDSAKPKPKKPMRHTLRRQTLETPYENFKLKSNQTEGSENSSKNGNEDYDKVDLKSANKKLLHIKKEREESHIYDHTSAENECQDYDTMKSTKVIKQFDLVTYNTLQQVYEEKNYTENKIIEKQTVVEAVKENDHVYDGIGQLETAQDDFSETNRLEK